MYKIGICDDEPTFCSELENYVKEYFSEQKEIVKIEKFASGEDYLAYLELNSSFDLLFLDIELGDMTGVEVGKKIREDLQNEVTQIVYVSSKEKYAMQLFQNRPMDFLVKPISKDEVGSILKKYQYLYGEKPKFFEYHISKQEYRVRDDAIMYVQCKGKKVQLYISPEYECKVEDTIFYGKMSDIEKKLQQEKFMVIHKSYIVNIRYVARIHPNEIIMTNGEILPISQSCRRQVKEWLLKYMKEEDSKNGIM